MIALRLLRVAFRVWRRVKSTLPAIIAKRLDKLEFKVSLSRKLRKNTPVIVYSMGRVGSTSVQLSLKSHGIKTPFHIHRLLLNPAQKKYWSPTAIWQFETLLSYIKKRKKAKFITLVREPVSRNISDFFFKSFTNITPVEYADLDLNVEELFKTFVNNYAHSVPLTWFDMELKPVLGIDIYEYPFPKEKGFLTIDRGNFQLLIIKVEIADSVKEKAIGEFLGIADFKLTRRNASTDKHYANTYRDFLETVELPQTYVEIMCSSEYTRHFYTDTDIEATRETWRNNVGKSELPAAVYEELLRASHRALD